MSESTNKELIIERVQNGFIVREPFVAPTHVFETAEALGRWLTRWGRSHEKLHRPTGAAPSPGGVNPEWRRLRYEYTLPAGGARIEDVLVRCGFVTTATEANGIVDAGRVTTDLGVVDPATLVTGACVMRVGPLVEIVVSA